MSPGAGIILIERNYRGKGPAFIFFRDREQKLWGGLGGGNQGTILETAYNETIEESVGTIVFDDKELIENKEKINYVDLVKNGILTYRNYFIMVDSGIITKKLYMQNLKKIKKNDITSEWMETDNVKRIYVNDYYKKNRTNRMNRKENKKMVVRDAIILNFNKAKKIINNLIDNDLYIKKENVKFKKNVIKPNGKKINLLSIIF
jgi:hypothetical protein